MTTTLPLLGASGLSRVPAESRPLVLPGSVPAGILHFGLSAFHRAHQAVYTEEAVAAAGGDWGIIGVAPHSTAVLDALAAQDRLFSVTTLPGSGPRVIGAFCGLRHAATDPDAVVALLADPAIRVVTLTITEKGYLLDPATGTISDALRADLASGRAPRTVPGQLVRGLLARWRADGGPIALVSCDNLPSNGRQLAGLIDLALRALSPVSPGDAVLEWVAANVTFPGTMVDRIVPATTPAMLDAAAAALGARDLAAVCGEPYKQWVLEDDFPGGRPAWEQAGAVLTTDAGPWERLKLRTLNGVHSAIAYLGALAGRETIAEALALPGMEATMRRLIADDIAASLVAPPGVTVVEYGEQVLARFANPEIRYQTVQVAMDGSQKLPQRVLRTIADLRAAGATPRWATLVVAAWMRFARGVADDGRELPLNDPLAATIRERLAAAPDTPAGTADALLGLTGVFPAELAADSTVRDLIVEWLTDLSKHGAAATLAGRA